MELRAARRTAGSWEPGLLTCWPWVLGRGSNHGALAGLQRPCPLVCLSGPPCTHAHPPAKRTESLQPGGDGSRSRGRRWRRRRRGDEEAAACGPPDQLITPRPPSRRADPGQRGHARRHPALHQGLPEPHAVGGGAAAQPSAAAGGRWCGGAECGRGAAAVPASRSVARCPQRGGHALQAPPPPSSPSSPACSTPR